VNIIGGKREPADAERADGGTLGRRGVLGGLAALPVLAGVAAATPALAAPAARPASAPAAADDLVRGQERRYNAPLLAPGTRLVLPVLWVYGEFGATKEASYRDRFYTLALQPLSRNPYPRSTTIL
jgi:hypothetical protein